MDDLNEHLDEPAVVQVLLEVVELGSLQQSFHASEPALVVSVDLHHLDEVLVSVQAVDVLGDQWEQVAQDGQAVDLELLKLWWLPSA